MKFHVKKNSASAVHQVCLILTASGKSLTPSSSTLLSKSKLTSLNTLIKNQLGEKQGDTLTHYFLENEGPSVVLIVQLGKNKALTPREAQKLFKTLAQLSTHFSQDIAMASDAITVESLKNDWVLSQFCAELAASSYVFNRYKSSKEKKPARNFTFITRSEAQGKLAKEAVHRGDALGHSQGLLKDLANTPANICTPAYLATQAKKLATQYTKLKVTVLSEEKIRTLKMGSLLSVSQGSKNAPKLITFEYKGGKPSQKPIVFAGKGVTFDTGGNSLKPAASMIGMKYDMCGGATVFGIMQFAAMMKLPLNIVGVIGAVENMPGSSATRPEDIVTSMSGKTIEILNTDAEGRLVLCDVLTYIEKFKPDCVIDIATLTGAVTIALGNEVAGIMGNDQDLIDSLVKAGNTVKDLAWQLPIVEAYQADMDSHFADLRNIGTPGGAGTITAACFLSRFAENYRWAHMDIAGVATRGIKGFGRADATGRPLPLLAEFLMQQSSKKH